MENKIGVDDLCTISVWGTVFILALVAIAFAN